MTLLPKKLQQKLNDRSQDGTLRQLGQSNGLVDFSSNDYLGFAGSEELFSKTFQLLLKYNVSRNGATGSRLLTGNHALFEELETMLAGFHSAETALVFNSGYDANIGLFGCVPQRGDFVFYDEFIHASIRDGLQLSHAKSYKFSHNSLVDLKEKIDKTVTGRDKYVDADIYIVTESVFSMDGDTPNLNEFAIFCKSKGYRLIVDEAHAVGIYGKKGVGKVQELGLQKEVFARTVTFGKSLGVHGAAVLCGAGLREFLINFSRSFIYTTALPPHAIISIMSSYAYLQGNGDEERKRLLKNIQFFKNRGKELKLNDYFIESDSPIQSCVLPSNDSVKSVSKKLRDKGFDVKSILSPTVPEGKERLRFCIHSFNSREEIGLVLQLLSKYI